jgi:hypothetical protein
VSDQYGNHVDGEIWVPLRANDWIDKVEIGAVKDGSQKQAFPMPASLDSWKEYAFAHADGSINEERYKNEGTACQELQHIRRQLKEYGIPEEYHPVLMERTVEVIASSWKFRSE